MLRVGGLHILYRESQVILTLAQVIGGFPILQPGQLQGEIALPVSQVYQFKAAVSSLLFPHRVQAQGLIVEGQAPLQVEDIEIEMIESKHTGAPFLCCLSIYHPPPGLSIDSGALKKS